MTDQPQAPGSDVVFESSNNENLTDFGKRKIFSICLEAVVMEDRKFINAVDAFEALVYEELEIHEVKSDGGKKKTKYSQFIEDEENRLKGKYPNLNQEHFREMKLAFVKFRELINLVKHTEPLLVMYGLEPGRADLYSVEKLREYADNLLAQKPWGADAAKFVNDLADDLESELGKITEEKSKTAEIVVGA